MQGVRLILNDGTVIENGRTGESFGDIMLWFPEYQLQDVAQMVFDQNKMKKIISIAGDFENEYLGYTVCTMLTIDYSGEVTACMRKG